MAVAIEPQVATDVRRLHVVVETRGDHTRGETVVDYRGRTQPPNVDVVLGASRGRFMALLRDSLRG
jgi:inosine-uridine nucleoside N-ribohydrolase